MSRDEPVGAAQSARSQDRFYTVTIDGVSCRIATDDHQPGGRARDPQAAAAVRSIYESARAIRERDAAIE